MPVFNEAPVAVTPDLREALWEDAGLLRNASRLERLTSCPHLLTSPSHAGTRAWESRGGHFREDFPTESAAFVGLHTVRRRAGFAVELTAADIRASRRPRRRRSHDRPVVPAEARLDVTLAEGGASSGPERGGRSRADPSVGRRVVTAMRAGRRLGSARALLTGERTALNLLGRLSATPRVGTSKPSPTGATILDTRRRRRLRALEKLSARRRHEPPLRPFDGSSRTTTRASEAAAGRRLGVRDRRRSRVRDAEDVRGARCGRRHASARCPARTARRRRAVAAARRPGFRRRTLDTFAIAETGVDYISVSARTRARHSTFPWRFDDDR